MTIVLSLLTQLLHLALTAVAAPAIAGFADWLLARLGGRTGPPLTLPWRELVRLSRKTPVVVESVSVVSHFGPAVALGAIVAAVALVPSFTLGMALSPLSDGLVVVSLLIITRVAVSLVDLDAGAAAPGLHQQRQSALSVMADPGFILGVLALALMAGSFSLEAIITQQREGVLLPATASAVAVTTLLALFAAEISSPERLDDGLLSGIDLAMIKATGWLRRLVWMDLIGALFFPIGMAAADSGPLSWLVGVGAWAAKLVTFTVVLSVARTFLGVVPRRGLPSLVGVAALLAFLAIIMVLASAGMA